MAKDARGHGSAGRGGSAMDRAVAAIKSEFGGQQHPAQVAAQHGIPVDHLGPSTGDMHKDIANAVAHGVSKWGK